jgi:hypothetical protein
MAFVEFNGYSHGAKKFVNPARIVHFEQIGFNGCNGTELHMDDGSKIRVGHWPQDVQKMLQAAELQDGA